MLHVDNRTNSKFLTSTKTEETQTFTTNMVNVNPDTDSAISNKAHVNLAVGKYTRTSMTVPVYVSSSDNPSNEKLVYAMLDSQSDYSFILENACDELEVATEKVDLLLSTIFGNDEISTRRIRNLQVRSLKEDRLINIPITYTRPAIPANREHIPTKNTALK